MPGRLVQKHGTPSYAKRPHTRRHRWGWVRQNTLFRMLSLNYGSICIFLLLKSFWFETDKWHTTSFHNALETLLHTGNLPPRWYILYLHFSTQRPSGPSNPKRCSKELTRVFSKKFDNIVVCLCELAPSQIRPVTTL